MEASSSASISAYYSLVFSNITYFLQTLNVTIGRRCIPSSPESVVEVDVDLGPLKSVSRLHAKIEWDEDQQKFVLAVVGRNGAWVDGVWYGKDSRVSLSERSQIQIASRTFHFVLPQPALASPSPSQSQLSPSPTQSPRVRSPSLDIISAVTPPSSLPSPHRQDLLQAAKISSSKKRKKTATKASKTRPESELEGKTLTSTQGVVEQASADPTTPKPAKPPFTYAIMVYQAINALEGQATLPDICAWMRSQYDFYKHNENSAWETSVRHALSSNSAFAKVEKKPGEKSKTTYWTVKPEHATTLSKQVERAGKQSSADHLPTSVPNPRPTSNLPAMSSNTTMNIANDTPNSELEQVKLETSAIEIPPDLFLPIVVGPPYPEGTVLPSTSTSPPEPFTEAKPIIFHLEVIHLDPSIFSSITADQLSNLQALGARKALELLQTYMKNYLVGKFKGGKSEKKTKKVKGNKPPKTPKPPKEDKSPSGSLFTRAPLPPREPKLVPATTTVATPSQSASPRPVPYHQSVPMQPIYYAHAFPYPYPHAHMVMAQQMHSAHVASPPTNSTPPAPSPTPRVISAPSPTVITEQASKAIPVLQAPADPGSPILIVDDDSDEREAPAKKKRKAD